MCRGEAVLRSVDLQCVLTAELCDAFLAFEWLGFKAERSFPPRFMHVCLYAAGHGDWEVDHFEVFWS